MQCRISRVSPSSWSARREDTSNLTVVDSLNPSATTITGLFVELCCKGPLIDHIATSTEKFICKMYGVPDVDICNKARVKLFCISHQHRMQQRSTSCAAHYQASVLNQAHLPCPDLLPVTEMGWMHLDGKLVPRLLSLPPIPKSCREITSCGCTNGCHTQRCSCRKRSASKMCACKRRADVCRNIHDDMNDLEDRD